jgi:hypothetical protein
MLCAVDQAALAGYRLNASQPERLLPFHAYFDVGPQHFTLVLIE